eukprot:878147-Pelagomonas_calceolata.AAC.2
MQTFCFGPVECFEKDIKSFGGYHPDTFAICVMDASHSQFVDFREGEGGWDRWRGAFKCFICWGMIGG